MKLCACTLDPTQSAFSDIPGGPKKTGTVDTVDFQGLCSDQQLSFFTLLDRASFPHYKKHQDHQIWLRTFYFLSNFLWTFHFRDLPDLQSFEAWLMTNQWQIPKMTVHKKLLIK